jgi:hypothetical protein
MEEIPIDKSNEPEKPKSKEEIKINMLTAKLKSANEDIKHLEKKIEILQTECREKDLLLTKQTFDRYYLALYKSIGDPRDRTIYRFIDFTDLIGETKYDHRYPNEEFVKLAKQKGQSVLPENVKWKYINYGYGIGISYAASNCINNIFREFENLM